MIKPASTKFGHRAGNYQLWATGFTLVELLVVIAVIGILAGLLLPALSKAKAQAQTIQCLNNMKQLQLSWYLYADENGDWLSANYVVYTYSSGVWSPSEPSIAVGESFWVNRGAALNWPRNFLVWK